MHDATAALGTTLNQRYLLVSLLGSGASAHVYLAQDTTLERQVAVKILQPALAGDEAFLKRFRAEARAVAALNHPHVLQVYDWGEHESVPFIVTEYLAGGSLADLLADGVRLSIEQAASVGQQAASGLAYAHSRGLVHRDVKPANLLFDDEGRLRISDFGVARALAEASWTEPMGAMIGTVRYASPEQAEGLPVDGKADVYSLGLVLYEAMAGELPFIGDTPLALLRSRVGRSLPDNPALGPLAPILVAATAPEPALRLGAAELADGLGGVEALLPPPAALPLHLRPELSSAAGALGVASTIGFRPPSADELTQATPAVTGSVPSGVPPRGAAPIEPTVVAQPWSLEDSTVVGGFPDEAPPAHGAHAMHRRRRRRWPWVLALVVALGAGFGAFAVATSLFVPSVAVPGVVGRADAAATAALKAKDLTAVYAPGRYSTSVPEGHVISQDPLAGASIKQGSSVTLVLSKGLPPVSVPKLSGYTCDQATAALAAVHLKATCPPDQAAYSDTVPKDQVAGWSVGSQVNPAQVPYGSSVVLKVSKGPPPVAIPAVSGTYDQAAATLSAAGFQPTKTSAFSASVPAGDVIGTSPATGTLAQKGTQVTVTVSLGPGVTVPSGLVGSSPVTAASRVSAAGLNPILQGCGSVIRTVSPGSGATVAKGSSVTLAC
jgi:eukaryotic-like serine/threonine-protein kinase